MNKYANSLMTPQEKMIGVNGRIGNNFIKNQQGTTKMIYDSLPIDGRQVYKFFYNTNSRTFPFTNVKADCLPVAESLAIQRMSLCQITMVDSSGLISGWKELGSFATTEIPIIFGELSIKIANDTVMKPITVQNFIPEFNKNADNSTNNVFELNTNLIIPPQLEISAELIVPTHSSTAEGGSTNYLRLVFEGVGSQFNGKTTF